MLNNTRLQSKSRAVSKERRKRALFSCDRCKLRKSKCNRIQNNDLKYDNITPCAQCVKAGVSCVTSIPRKRRFYGSVKNISLHYKCLLALVTGIFPNNDIYNIDELMSLGHELKLEMPTLDNFDYGEKGTFANLKKEAEEEALAEEAAEAETEAELRHQNEHNKIIIEKNVENSQNEKVNQIDKEETVLSSDQSNYTKNEVNEENVTIKIKKEIDNTSSDYSSDTCKTLKLMKKLNLNSSEKENDTEIKDSDKLPVETKTNIKLPPNVKIPASNLDRERLIMDRFGHTHFIGNFGTASLLNGLCDIIIKRSYNKVSPPTSTQDIRDSSVQTITSETTPVYQYPTHLYNMDEINVDRFPLINIVGREEADVYVSVFFEKVHPYYFIFNEDSFMAKYEIFYEDLDIDITKDSRNRTHTLSRLSSAEICSIYTVWILGRRFQQYSNPENLPTDAVLDEEMIGKFIDIIKLSLADVVLTPSIDGIRLLILFSVYLSSIKIRESGYCLMELASIQAKSLGLHRKSIVNKFNDEKSDVMKRILWSLTKSETTLCCSFGRASAIPWEEIDIDFPEINDVKDEHFKIFYLQSCKLTKIIFEILDYKKKNQKDPLSLASVEKALYFKNKMQNFWNNLPEKWKDYKSLPIKRYKPKLHIQYHYYHITLTLPMFLYIVNSHNYIIKNDDPFLSLLVCGIRSSFKTAELVSFTDSKGFFNGTIYYDVFYCYNAIMVLTLTYILFKTKAVGKCKEKIDLKNLNDQYGINLEEILKSINLIRKLVLGNLHKIDGTMKRMSDIIETLLADLGIIQTLVVKYNAPKSNVKKIEDRQESGNTSVTSIPSGYSRIKLRYNKSEKRKRSPVSSSTSSKITKEKNIVTDTAETKNKSVLKTTDDLSIHKINADPEKIYPASKRSKSNPPMTASSSDDIMNLMNFKPNAAQNKLIDEMKNPLIDSESSTNIFQQYPEMSNSSTNMLFNNTPSITNTPVYSGDGIHVENEQSSNSSDINGVLSSLSLNTDLMDALFGTDILNLDMDADEHLFM